MTIDAFERSLADRTRGLVIAPDHRQYDSARSLFNGMLDRRPRLIFRPADMDDLVSAVRWASESDLAIAVRGGGHSVAGHSMPDDGFVIDLSRWRSATVDPGRRIAEAEGGCLLMDLDAATAGYGLAAPSGTFIDTGVGGLTLGGGISHIIASEGFGCDALIGVELVTADGRVVEVDEEREPDLLWALRGGGGNFGVVTRFRYRLTPLERMYSGSLSYRGPAVGAVLARLFELDTSAPDELSTQAIVFWSDEDGGPIVRINVDWRGEPDDGDAAIRALLVDPVPFATTLQPMTWLQAQARFTPIPFGLRHYWKGHLVSQAPAGLADAIITAAEGSGDEGFILVELIHGAAHRIPDDSAAFGGRRAVANVTALSIWQDAGGDEAGIAWGRRAAGLFEPYSLSGGGYLNYPEVDQTAARVAAAFGPERFARLRTIKRTWDPDNRFRHNANILPA
ncbi:MAG: FAD-binding oxidoreductase [Chloroflexota bacterium]|nr:MAG: FAD-binding oxidoreductase [Chloroflexota bacterium]